MASADQQTETAGAPGSEPAAPSPSQPNAERRAPSGGEEHRFKSKSKDEVIAELRARVTELEQGQDSLRRDLMRLAEATGRPDAILPAATAEQVRAAYANNGRLRVLTQFSRGNLVLRAGQTIEARHYPIDHLADLAGAGLLRVAVLDQKAA